MLNKYLLSICLVISLFGCSPTRVTTNPNLIWTVNVNRTDLKKNLSSVQAITQYDGSEINVSHAQSPASGDVYLILNVTISKTGSQSSLFDWQFLMVKDASGNTYPRLSNDTFLLLYQYSPRITGLKIQLGDYTGWMAYEIPASAAKGELTLSYTAAGSQQEIVLQK